MSAWLGVASAEHVRRAVALGIAQLNHGKRGSLGRLDAGDTLVFYSPVQRLGDRIALWQSTAIGERGYQLRRGFVSLDTHDLNVLRSAMVR